ncbi:MAG: hypothetical protein KC731_32255 [Myxococcales bacterium]|nr:hypothetical protein [Myxococcales bacterium]
MTALTPESRDLIDAARGGDDLGVARRQRLKRGLLTQVAVGAAVGTAAKAATAATAATTATTAGEATGASLFAGAFAAKLGATVVIAGALSFGAMALHEQATTDGGATPSVPSTALEPLAPPAAEALAQAEPQEAVQEPKSDVEAPVSDAPVSGVPVPAAVDPLPPSDAKPPEPSRRALAEETALLQRAQAELRAGNPEAALALLEEHRGRHALGAMSEEREAARILALCAAGRRDEARAAAADFLAAHPKSPHRARVLSACP